MFGGKVRKEVLIGGGVALVGGLYLISKLGQSSDALSIEQELRAKLPGYARELAPFFAKAALARNVPARLLVGIASRESDFGRALRRDGTGDYSVRTSKSSPASMPYAGPDGHAKDGLGWGRGIMQIDYAFHDFARGSKWRDPEANIDYGAKVLRDAYNHKLTIAGAGGNDALRWRIATAAYNAGVGGATKGLKERQNPDSRTTGGDYSADVGRRANDLRIG